MVHYRYVPQDSAWIGISDMWNTVLARIDCRQGGAQEVFDDLCHDFKRAGWLLEERKFDWRFVRRDGVRWEIRIGVPGPEHRDVWAGILSVAGGSLSRGAAGKQEIAIPAMQFQRLHYAMTRLIGATPQSAESICSCTTPRPAARHGSEGRLCRQLECFLSL
jgi:hypothetical protein